MDTGLKVSLTSRYAPLPVDHYLFPLTRVSGRITPTLRYVHKSRSKTSYSPLRTVSENIVPKDMTASNIVFSVFSAIGLVLSLIPLWWHLESWNVGTCMFMIWTALACLVYFVDSVVWSGNTINWAPVWCDIGTFRNPPSLNSHLSWALPSCSYSGWYRCRMARLRPLHHPPPSYRYFL